MTQESKSISLFKKEGTSNKEYRVQLMERDGGWVVTGYNGRRGSALKPQPKTPAPVTYEEAEKVYTKLVAKKMKDGYTSNEDGRTYQDLPEGKVHSGVRLQLLTDLDRNEEDRIQDLLADPLWVAQQKHDGERRALIRKGNVVQGTNREGFVVPLAQPVVDALLEMESDDFVLDGEDMGTHIEVFDLLHCNGHDMTVLPFGARLKALNEQLATPEGAAVRLASTAVTAEQKALLFSKLRDLDQEGVVFKRIDAPYAAGRSDLQLKVKFKAEATVQVIERHATKRSASIGLLLSNSPSGPLPTLVPVGNVTLPPSVEVNPGDLIEVQYLYAYEQGSLFQPVFKSVRTDKIGADTIGSLKYKAESVSITPDSKPSRERMTA